MRAQVWYMRKVWTKAIEDYSAAYRLSFGHQIDYVKGLANAYMQNGDWKLGMDTATDCLRLEADADMYLCRGLCRRKLNDLAGALDDYSAGIKLDSKNLYLWQYRGILLDTLKRGQDAIRDYDQAIKLDPKNAEVIGRRARSLACLGSFDRAAEGFAEAIRLAPKDPAGYCYRAWFRAGCPDAKYRDTKGAVSDAKLANELSNWSDARSLEALAAAYARSGDFEEAVRWQKRAMEKNSNYSKSEVEAAHARLDAYSRGVKVRFTVSK
jgi:tetratricopeptide (TPR) repeat protein